MNFRILIIVFVIFASCDKPVFKKPDNVITRNKMISMLVDIHLAEALFQNRQYKPEEVIHLKSEEYYYSVLKKYGVADSTFEESLVYYGSLPKDFEKMYAKVLDKLHLLEQKYNPMENKPVDIGNKQ